MTKDEITTRIEKLNAERFYLAMIDHWTTADIEKDDKLFREILALEKML